MRDTDNGLSAKLIFWSKFPITMLKKLSKCEVRVAWRGICLTLRFYVKSNFGEFKQSENVIFGNFRDLKL